MPAVADKTDREGIMKMEQTGRLTLPTDADVVAETLRLKNLLGADALRDCDGTEMPKELLTDPAKKYATYFRPARTTPGRRQTPTRSSRSISSVTDTRRAARSCAST